MLCVISGFSWTSGSPAGVFGAYLINTRTNSYDAVGLRSASIPPETPRGETGNEGDGFLPAMAKSLCAPLFCSEREDQRGVF